MTAAFDASFDPKEFRRALGCFVTGVTVVTTIDGNGEPRGLTANSFTSVSLDPPLVLVCIAKTSGSYDAFLRSDVFAINILQDSQRNVSASFAQRRPDKFCDQPYAAAVTGSPILADCAAWIDCQTHQQVDAGDHTILIGRVVDFEHTPRTPLGYYGGRYVDFGIERRAVEQLTSDQQVLIGGIFERDGDVLMIERGGALYLPEALRLGTEADSSHGLFAEIGRLGYRVSVSFVYAVFQDRESAVLHVFYRGEVSSAVNGSAAVRFVPLTALDEQPIAKRTTRHMLRRFAREMSSGFGVYVGDSANGVVRTLTEPNALLVG